jgi:hypothetical protein
MRILLPLILLLGAFAAPLSAQRPVGSLRGELTDARTGEPLLGANVLLVNSSTGAATDLDGVFLITNIPVGVYSVRFQSLGYESFIASDVVIRSQRQTDLRISLNPSVVTGQEVVVTGGYFKTDRANPVSSASFNPEEMRRSPGSGQELARVLSVLPGVVARGEVSQDIMVRGGSPSENGFYIDNIPMPGVAHFQSPGGSSNGPIGIVNTDLIGDVTFYTGGFSAAYGDRTSAIGDVSYREGTRDRYAGDLTMSLGGAGITVEGPMANGRGSVLLSARRSYLDIIADAINTGGAPTYTDIQMKAVYDAHARHRFTFLAITGSSSFVADEDQAADAGLLTTTDANYAQATFGLNHRFVWSAKGFTQTSISTSWKTDDTRSLFYRSGLTDARIDIRNTFHALRSISRYSVSDALQLEFGGDVRMETGDYDYFVAGGTTGGGAVRPDITRDLSLEGIVAGGFITTTISPLPKWSISAGLRADHSNYNNETTLDPRVSTTYSITEKISLNAAFGYYSQVNDRFLMSQYTANEDLKSIRARHLMAGVDVIVASDTKLTFEVFDKTYTNVPELPAGTAGYAPFYVPDNGFLLYETPLQSTGTSWARGAEMFLQKKLAQDFYGMASVAYFRTQYKGFDDRTYNRNFDTKFQTSVIGGWRPNDEYEVSVRWSYIGGRPYTPVDEAASQPAETTVYDLSRLNTATMPAYHALYLRADRRYFFKRTNVVTFLELWNAYARSNVDGYFWSPVDNKVTSISQFSFIPVGGVKFEF